MSIRLGICARWAIAFAAGAVLIPVTPRAQSAPTFKVAYFNIQSGRGEPAIPGHPVEFTDNHNCTDPAQPLNAWGIGLVQRHLMEGIGNDPTVIALGLSEAWFCGTPENVRKALGWKANTANQNGVAMVVRYGFAGPEEWRQLDTSLNPNPADTMWVVRAPVCLDAACSQSVNVFVGHWLGMEVPGSLDRQGQQTVEFLQSRGGQTPHVFIGDLNAWEGVPVCSQIPDGGGLPYLRNAGYVDAWPAIHGDAEGFTGMVNRSTCGNPVGYPFKRIDYAWSPAGFPPLSIQRFAMVPPGDGAPSDHYGIVAQYSWPGAPPPVDTTPPTVRVTAPVEGATISTSTPIEVSATDASGIARVEILEDGVVAHTLTSTPYRTACNHLWQLSEGQHTIQARAVDSATGNGGSGNVGTSPLVRVAVQRGGSTTPPADIILHAKDATVITGGWRRENDPLAAGGVRLAQQDLGAAKITTPLAGPQHYFELTFQAQAGVGYRLWFRASAAQNYWLNDSAYVQFSGSVDSGGAPLWRIGTTSATTFILEECGGCPMSGWGWQDNGYGAGVLGPLVYFGATGPQTIRVQAREDGLAFDQIVLSSARYLSAAPGSPRNDQTVLPATTSAPAPPPPPASREEIVIRASAATRLSGGWRLVSDATAAGGVAATHPDAGAAKILTPLVQPVHYLELTFEADAGRPYRLWMRGRADADAWFNDSVFVQFSGTVASGQPVYRIGTDTATSINLEEASHAGVSGWGWQDNGYGAGVLGPLLTFATSGVQTIRIQTREDGLRIDQIVLSSRTYVSSAPGASKNDATIIPW